MASVYSCIAVFASLLFGIVAPQAVKELTDEFLSKRGEDPYLIMFYAPWCGHCRKMAPAFHRVGMALKNSGVTVAKIDSTRFQSTASQFEVKGFPTVKFIKGEKVYTHNGERTKDDLVQFAQRANGPAVSELISFGKFTEVRSKHSDEVFFFFAGDITDPFGEIYTKFKDLADQYLVHSYFYSGSDKILPEEYRPSHSPAVLAFKDGTFYTFQSDWGSGSKKELEDWINRERFTAFPRIGASHLNDLGRTKRLVVILVLTENKDKSDDKKVNERCKELMEILALKKRDKYHDSYQFAWMDETETVNSIMMTEVATPNLLVLNTDTQFYYLSEIAVENMTLAQLEEFLENVKSEKIPAYGGTGFLQRLKRLFYDIFTTIAGIWAESRLLFFIMFGIPTAIISLVCYGLCCIEPYDGPEDEDELIENEDQGQICDEKPKEIKDADDEHIKKE